MNRVLKFRTWHIPTKQMHEVASFDEHFVHLGWNAAKSDADNYKVVDHPLERKDCLLLQFTGIVDIVNREIWEGDIIRWSHFDEREGLYSEAYYKVVFQCGCFGVLSVTGDADFAPFEKEESRDLVVGTVFADAQLLGQNLSLSW